MYENASENIVCEMEDIFPGEDQSRPEQNGCGFAGSFLVNEVFLIFQV